LTADEVALVLRRAAELEAETATADRGEAVAASVVLEAAEEVGLSPALVRQAIAELGTGTLVAQAARAAPLNPARRRLTVGPESVTQTRVVAAAPEQVLAEVDRYLRRRGYQRRRRQGQWVLYRPGRDLLRQLQRIVDTEGARQLTGASAVVVTVCPVPDAGTMVRLEATLEPGWRGFATTAAAYGTLAITGTVAVVTGNPAPLMAGAPVGAFIGTAGWERRRRWRHRRSHEIGETLAALLDRLD
jgi:hypothetical protein